MSTIEWEHYQRVVDGKDELYARTATYNALRTLELTAQIGKLRLELEDTRRALRIARLWALRWKELVRRRRQGPDPRLLAACATALTALEMAGYAHGSAAMHLRAVIREQEKS